MKSGLLIINGYGITSGTINQVERLTEEFKKLGVTVDLKKNNEILTCIQNNVIVNLPKYDFVLYLDKDKYVARMLTKAGYRLFNSIESIELCDDKMLTHIALANSGIKMPKTISSTLCYRDNGNRDFSESVLKELSFPFIVKENYGSLGKQVYLVNNKSEFMDIENRLIHIPHIYQEFISSSVGKDYRVIVIGHEVVAYMKRENKHSYLSNLASGGSASVVKLPENYLNMAIKASKILRLDYCGVDLLEGPNNEPILSEVNSNAFFEGIEKITGINVASEYAKYIYKTVYNC